MSSLFDLPFDDPSADAAPRATSGAARPSSPRATSARRVLTVSQLTAAVRGLLETEFYEVWVEGELSGCKVWNTGHLYFVLKDASAQVKGVMFRSALRALRFQPRDGLRVVARGKLSVYEPKGEYQFICEHLEPEGLGARQLAFEQLKARLAAEGLFAPERKRTLPALPRRIGIVTSLDGAAVRDILQILRRRYANAHIVIRPTRVQGDDAALEISRAVMAIGGVPDVDVVIVGRGGGAREDLWAFNEEVVARAIAGCRVPIISAVGHETDVTLADFVADLRAPTPSAAAELVVAKKDELTSAIDRLEHRLRASLDARLHRAESRLRSLDVRPAFAGMPARLASRARHTEELAHDLTRAMRERLLDAERSRRHLDGRLAMFDPRRRLSKSRTRLVTSHTRLLSGLERRRHDAAGRLRSAMAGLENLSPLAVLARGYAVCWNQDRSALVRDAATVAVGEQVHVRVGRGELACRVERSGTPDVLPNRTPTHE